MSFLCYSCIFTILGGGNIKKTMKKEGSTESGHEARLFGGE